MHSYLQRAYMTGLIAMAALAAATGANAQNRLPPIPAEQFTAQQQKAADDFKAARGTALSGPFMPLLRSPELMTRARAMGDYLRFNSALPPRLSEFVILLTAREWTQNYEWGVHYDLAIKAGVKPAIAKAIADGRRPDGMSDEEDAVYTFVTELQRHRSVSDATYSRMLERFGERAVVDTTGIVGYYTLLAMVLNVARTPPDGAPALAPLQR